MKFVVAAGAKTGFLNLEYILEKTDKCPEVVFTSSRDFSKWEQKIVELCDKHNVVVKSKVSLNSEDVRDYLKELKLDLGFLLWWPEILKQDAISVVDKGWVNTHPSYLPYNRGKNPYYWSIVDGTPHGVTLHYIDVGIDTGKILFQKEIPVTITDTGESLYAKSEIEMVSLFQEKFESILNDTQTGIIQDDSKATSHFEKSLLDEVIDLDKSYNALDLINKLRARTFSNGPSNYFFKDGKKYFIRVQIEEDKSS